MKAKPSHRSSVFSHIEALESRTFLSACPLTASLDSAAPVERSAVVRAAKVPKPVTKTTLKIQAGTLGQGAVFTATVRAAAALGSPAGTVTILDHGNTVSTITLAPSTSANAKFATSTGVYTLAPGAGGQPFFFGPHRESAVFASAGSLSPSTGKASFNVKMPKYIKAGGGLKVASVEPGSGPAVQVGQMANMLYTGYLVAGGSIFDNSYVHGTTPYPFVVQADPAQANVIAGFDLGAMGMQVGETRVVYIPAALGYGASGSGSIPPGADLIFLITLQSIS